MQFRKVALMYYWNVEIGRYFFYNILPLLHSLICFCTGFFSNFGALCSSFLIFSHRIKYLKYAKNALKLHYIFLLLMYLLQCNNYFGFWIYSITKKLAYNANYFLPIKNAIPILFYGLCNKINFRKNFMKYYNIIFMVLRS